MNETPAAPLRTLPSVNKVTEAQLFGELAEEFGEGLAKLELRALLEELREQLRAGELVASLTIEQLLAELRPRLFRLSRPEGRRAINASGILLHTGLGRSPLCPEALQALGELEGYSVLQADLVEGQRNERDAKVARMLVELTGGEAATVVNNNAAATALILSTVAAGREVIISRGQLIEIGGQFRIPDVMQRSGAVLREVGTTNRTHLRDYEEAITPNTAALMHIHTSNFRVRGFAGTPPIEELAPLGRQRGLTVIDDLGSGALMSLHRFGLPDEPLVRDSIAAGSDVVCFSGDKLICGPQSGIIVGRREILQRLRKNPLARMFRVCKLTLAALEATLIHFLNGEAERALPFYRMLARPLDELEAQGQRLLVLLGEQPELASSLGDDLAYVGSGSIPDQGLASRVVRLVHTRMAAGLLARRLRLGIPAVFGRLKDRALLLDMRTVQPDEVELLAARIREAVT